MRQARTNLGLVALMLAPIACCIGLPLLVATSVSVAVVAWIGGIAVGGIALAAAAVVLVTRIRRRRRDSPSSLHVTRSRS